MRLIHRLALTLACPVVVASCGASTGTAAAAGSATANSTAASSAPVRNRNILTREEIMRGEYQTAYDAVLALRRTWVTERPADRLADNRSLQSVIQVYIDDMRMGPISELQSIAIVRVAEVRWIDGAQAYNRWGHGHDRGVVQVITVLPTPRP